MRRALFVHEIDLSRFKSAGFLAKRYRENEGERCHGITIGDTCKLTWEQFVYLRKERCELLQISTN